MFSFPLKIKKATGHNAKHLHRALGIHTRGEGTGSQATLASEALPPPRPWLHSIFEKIVLFNKEATFAPFFHVPGWLFNHSEMLFVLCRRSPKQDGDVSERREGVPVGTARASVLGGESPSTSLSNCWHKIGGDQVCASRKYQKGKLYVNTLKTDLTRIDLNLTC